MFWDDLVRRWRRDNRQLGPRLLAGTAGYVAVAPTRRRRSRVPLVLLIIAVGVLLALAVATGRVQTPTRTGGLDRAEAIAAAQRAYPADGVIAATVGRIDSFEPGQALLAGDHLVWAIVESGRFGGSCGPALYPGWTPRPCPSPATRATVIVDFMTGEFIMASWTTGP